MGQEAQETCSGAVMLTRGPRNERLGSRRSVAMTFGIIWPEQAVDFEGAASGLASAKYGGDEDPRRYSREYRNLRAWPGLDVTTTLSEARPRSVPMPLDFSGSYQGYARKAFSPRMRRRCSSFREWQCVSLREGRLAKAG